MRSQGRFGANYSVNGHRTSGERRVDFNKGYSFLFERCFEENTLEEIEKIDWSHVTVKTLDANYPPCSLPEGYSFVVKDIQYIKCYDSFEVTIEVDKQYWGDVTPYQAQIAELTAASEAKDSELSEKNALIAEKAQQIAQKDSKIAEMADAEQAAKILQDDANVDLKERDIESKCLKLLLEQQPVASDLRKISSALKMITDLERIGDQAEDIAEIIQFLAGRSAENDDLLREMARSDSTTLLPPALYPCHRAAGRCCCP